MLPHRTTCQLDVSIITEGLKSYVSNIPRCVFITPLDVSILAAQLVVSGERLGWINFACSGPTGFEINVD